MAPEIIIPGTDCILLYLGGVIRSQFKRVGLKAINSRT